MLESPRSKLGAGDPQTPTLEDDEFEEEDDALYKARSKKSNKRPRVGATSSQTAELVLNHDELMSKQIAELCRRVQAVAGVDLHPKLKKAAVGNFFDLLCCLALDDVTMNEET